MQDNVRYSESFLPSGRMRSGIRSRSRSGGSRVGSTSACVIGDGRASGAFSGILQLPCSFKPDTKWMVSQAHAFIEQAREADLGMEYLIRDRDGMYVEAFEQIFKDIGCRVMQTSPQSPNQNAYIERWIKSVKFECLNFFVVFGKRHFDHLVTSYLEFYNEVRPHQSLGNRPLTGNWHEVDEPLAEGEQIICYEKLGGLLRHYERVAA